MNVIVVGVVFSWGDVPGVYDGRSASERLSMTETETLNERLCAHTLGDHNRAWESL